MQPPTREEIEEQFEVVHLTQWPSEAERVAAQLRKHDVLAIAHAVSEGMSGVNGLHSGEQFLASVLVHKSDLDRAKALLGDEAPEGDASIDEIERDLADPSSGGWQQHVPAQRSAEQKYSRAALLLGLLLVVIVAGAALGWW